MYACVTVCNCMYVCANQFNGNNSTLTYSITQVVEMALVKLQLKEHADKPVSAYSGGNRRKLSTAIALLARPPVVFLVC